MYFYLNQENSKDKKKRKQNDKEDVYKNPRTLETGQTTSPAIKQN